MADSQRSKAAALVDGDVLSLGKMTQRTTKTTNPVEQANMSRQGPANPQPRLTPTSRPFKKGGAAKSSAKGKMQKAAAVAGMLSALTQPQGGAPAGGPPMGAPPAGPMAGPPMGAPPGMKHGGRYKDGGASGKIADEDMSPADTQKLVMGMPANLRGKHVPEDAQGNEMRGMKRGGATKAPMNGMRMKKAGGGASHVPMKGAANKKPDSGTGGNLVPRNKAGRAGYANGGNVKHGDEAQDKKLFGKMFKAAEAKEGPEKMKRGGKCMKCGGAMGAGHACGGRMMKAMGGVAKMRKGVADKAGKPIAQKKHSYEDSLI